MKYHRLRCEIPEIALITNANTKIDNVCIHAIIVCRSIHNKKTIKGVFEAVNKFYLKGGAKCISH